MRWERDFAGIWRVKDVVCSYDGSCAIRTQEEKHNIHKKKVSVGPNGLSTSNMPSNNVKLI